MYFDKAVQHYKVLCVCRPLGSENLLLRGATLKNTEYIYGNSTGNIAFCHFSTVFCSVILNMIRYLPTDNSCEMRFKISVDNNNEILVLSSCWSRINCTIYLCLHFSCCHLHWHGNQNGSQLPVQVSEKVCSRKVSCSFFHLHFLERILHALAST